MLLSVFWSTATTAILAMVRRHIYTYVLIYEYICRSRGEHRCRAHSSKIGAFVVVVHVHMRVHVCVCCEGETCGQIFPPFFLFIFIHHSYIAVLRAHVYYLICFVMYTQQGITQM